MGVLSNAKHERFAQALAKGETATDAYVLAGYKANDGNAATLKGNQRIADRLAELLERAATRTEVTVAGITERLMNLAAVAEQTGIVTDEETGNVTGSSSKHLSVARAALMDAAKLNGLVTDQTQFSGQLVIAEGGVSGLLSAVKNAQSAAVESGPE